MLTNNQFKYISYGIMIFIVLILICNIYLTKINNNYTSSGLIEGFGNSKDAKKLNTEILDLISKFCDKKNKDEVISYAKSFSNDIPKLKGLMVVQLMKNIENQFLGNSSSKDVDIQKFITNIKDTIDTLNVIESNIKYLETDCGGGLFSGGLFSGGVERSSSDSKKSKSWFSDTSDDSKKDKKKSLFGWIGNNSDDDSDK